MRMQPSTKDSCSWFYLIFTWCFLLLFIGILFTKSEVTHVWGCQPYFHCSFHCFATPWLFNDFNLHMTNNEYRDVDYSSFGCSKQERGWLLPNGIGQQQQQQQLRTRENEKILFFQPKEDTSTTTHTSCGEIVRFWGKSTSWGVYCARSSRPRWGEPAKNVDRIRTSGFTMMGLFCR